MEKIVLIAGGAGDVGEGLVRAFLGDGATVVVPSRSAEKLAALREEINASARLHTYTVDVGNETEATAFRDRIAEEKGFSGAEYATFAYLHDECDFPEGEAQRVAETLCEALDEEVDTSYPGWWKNTDARRAIKVQIYQALRETDTPENLDLMSVGSELRDYLIANYVDNSNR